LPVAGGVDLHVVETWTLILPMASKQFKSPEWRRILKSGYRIYLGSGATSPVGLMESLLENIEGFSELEILQGLTLGSAPWMEARYHSQLKVNAFFLDPRLSELVNAGVCDYTPAHYSEIAALMEQQVLRIDIALIMVSPPDAFGYCSMGPTVEWNARACKEAQITVAQINPAMPRTMGMSFIHQSEIDFAMELESELPVWPELPGDPVFDQIGNYAAQLVDDGDTLQSGVGPVGQSLARHLVQHRHLGIHSEVIGDGVMKLLQAGVIDNSNKSMLPGKVIAAQGLGSSGFYSFLNHNPHIDFRPTEFVNSPMTIARNDNLVSVNGAAMVDLTGQVVVDTYKGSFRRGIGSIVDFIRGAAMARRGRPIIALPSTEMDEAGKRQSCIFAELPSGAGVACNRADIYYVVTEYGVATLRGRTIQERVKELVQVAHPDFREDLLAKAHANKLVPHYFQLPPPYETSGMPIPQRKIQLRDGKPYLLRPLNPSDDRRLQEFFYSHTEETIVRRYGFTLTRMSSERAFKLVGVDQNRDLALGIFELQGPRQVICAVGRYYLDENGRSAEMAFVVGENRRRLGMAKTLLDALHETAKKRQLDTLWAQVDRINLPMLKLFRSLGAAESPGDESHSVRIEISCKESLVP